ncbi:vanadium-dependent haloperoxidase [Sphingomonas jaspsi]|uniref:vanadium-dependent haloperoxidase n=1 Tax=Sphingomonas jaspsi TaxID=392409 RepID=UPI0004B30F12|nr:vanadium-dependent haloperoxidase [Sphingomonas jaspsi]
MRSITFVATAALACAIAAPARADIITDRASYALKLDGSADRTADNAPTNSQVAAAMFEAANAIDRRYEPLLGLAAATRPASTDAAVIVAARDVLLAHYPTKKDRILENASFALDALGGDPAARAEGERIGAAAAAAALTRGTLDPAVKLVDYRPRTSPGTWVGASLPVFQPYWQGMHPWALASPSAIRPGPPPALTSERYARDFDEVKRLGGTKSTERTPHQSLMARYRITPDIMPTVRRIAGQPGRRAVDNARLLALLWIGEYDEGLAMIDAKMHYNFWRPITAIRNAEDDGNPTTTPDAGWTPMINTPNHPEYPCGHCGYASVTAEILKAEVGNAPPGGVEIASDSIDDAVVMRLPTFDKWVQEVSFSRTLGGVHYRFSNEAAEDMGRKVATAVLGLMKPLKTSSRRK